MMQTAGQIGGANAMNTFLGHIPPVQYTLYGIALILGIIYVNQIPSGVRTIADTAVGRILGIIGIYLSIRYLGWIYALLFTIFFILILHGAPRLEEGFHAIERKDIDTPTSLWFVEKVLGEHPKRIETDTITTESVSDNSQKNMGSRGRGGK